MRGMMNALATIAWKMPYRFELANRFFPGLGGRALVFHDIAAVETPLTKGLGVSLSPADFECALEFLRQHYTFVDLDGWLRALESPQASKPALLLTFDDAYASVARVALPICRRLSIPAVMFLNASFVDNRALSLDNLICYVVNTFGLELVETTAGRRFRELASVYSEYLPDLDAEGRRNFARRLAQHGEIDVAGVLRDFSPYMRRDEVLELVNAGFEIGNHTLTHPHLRGLTPAECLFEIEGNKRKLEEMTGQEIRTFSVPYGAREDSHSASMSAIKNSGHQNAFLVEGRLNSSADDPFQLMRVSLKSVSSAAIFAEIELLPRLREHRKRFMRKIA
jgi:peptidoglycan/xylan/chitin deacetylase (PgdA/CDA1 family)